MKARPRGVERNIALLLSEIFCAIGYERVLRIPVLGREGPDISINEFGLVVDVKSRISVPLSYVTGEFVSFDCLLGIPLCEMQYLADMSIEPVDERRLSKTVSEWFFHMDKWRTENYSLGITALILHRPKMPYGNSTLIIHNSQRKEFCQKWNKRI